MIVYVSYYWRDGTFFFKIFKNAEDAIRESEKVRGGKVTTMKVIGA